MTKNTVFVPHDQPFKLLYQNMQSIFNKQHILEAFTDQYPFYQALCITETWLTPEKLEVLKITSFNVAASYCRKSHMGGGVCILLSDDLEFKEKKDIAAMSVEYVLEVCAAELPLENILIITMYWNRREEDLFFCYS